MRIVRLLGGAICLLLCAGFTHINEDGEILDRAVVAPVFGKYTCSPAFNIVFGGRNDNHMFDNSVPETIEVNVDSDNFNARFVEIKNGLFAIDIISRAPKTHGRSSPNNQSMLMFAQTGQDANEVALMSPVAPDIVALATAHGLASRGSDEILGKPRDIERYLQALAKLDFVLLYRCRRSPT